MRAVNVQSFTTRMSYRVLSKSWFRKSHYS